VKEILDTCVREVFSVPWGNEWEVSRHRDWNTHSLSWPAQDLVIIPVQRKRRYSLISFTSFMIWSKFWKCFRGKDLSTTSQGSHGSGPEKGHNCVFSWGSFLSAFKQWITNHYTHQNMHTINCKLSINITSLHISAINHHPQGDVKTKEYII